MADSNLTKKGVPVCNETYMLKVSKNRLEAVIFPREGAEGIGDIDTAALLAEVKATGVESGLLEAPTPKGDGSYLVAKGEAAVHGENAKLRTHVKPAIVRAPKSLKPGKDNVDYRELGAIVNVPKDKLLLSKIVATPGTEGKDVFGQKLTPKGGKDLKIKIGPGVTLSEDEMQVTSGVEGKFMLADGKAAVLTEHTISGDIDLAVGNIAFVGERLIINGTVLPGFKVKCKQDIYIAQGVENADISAGGNLEIKGGVIGADVILRSWGDIIVDFAENIGKIEVRGSLTISDSIIQANVKTGGDVYVLQGKGTLIGGKYIVGGSVYVKELGSDAEVVTELSVGMNPELEEKKRKLDEEKAVWPVKMSEILKNTTALKKMQKEEGADFPQEKNELLKKLNDQLPFVMDKVNEITVQEETMDEEMAKTINECVYVYGTVYPGVRVNVGSHSRVLSSEENSVAIYFDKTEHKIKLRTLTEAEKEKGSTG